MNACILTSPASNTTTPEQRLEVLEARYRHLEGQFERLVASVDGLSSYLNMRAQVEKFGVEILTH
jgi:hypothetical protein